jgi:hypothetical protein
MTAATDLFRRRRLPHAPGRRSYSRGFPAAAGARSQARGRHHAVRIRSSSFSAPCCIGGANRSARPRLALSDQYCEPWARQQKTTRWRFRSARAPASPSAFSSYSATASTAVHGARQRPAPAPAARPASVDLRRPGAPARAGAPGAT